MNETIGNSLRFVAFFTKTKTGITSLSPTVDVYRNGVLIVTAGAATAIGGGLYVYTLLTASVDQEGDYLAIFKTTDTTVDQQHIPALWEVGKADVERLALIQAKTDNLPASPASETTLAAVKAKTDNLPGSPAAVGSAMTLTAGERGSIADAVCDEALSGHGTSGTVGHALILARAQAAGKWSIAGDVLSIYDLDGTTLLATLDLAPAGGPYVSRTP